MPMGKGSKGVQIFWGDIGQVLMMAKQSEIPLKNILMPP